MNLRCVNKNNGLFLSFFNGCNMHSALDSLFHHFAGGFIRFVDIPLEMIIVRRTASAANKFRKTVAAPFAGKKTGRRKFFSYVFIKTPLVNITHQKILIASELVARINIAVRHYGKILIARPACRNFLLEADAALQIDIEMEEIKAFAFSVLFKIFVAKIFIFVQNCGQMFGLYRQIVYFRNNRLHRYAVETVFGKKNNVF